MVEIEVPPSSPRIMGPFGSEGLGMQVHMRQDWRVHACGRLHAALIAGARGAGRAACCACTAQQVLQRVTGSAFSCLLQAVPAVFVSWSLSLLFVAHPAGGGSQCAEDDGAAGSRGKAAHEGG